MTMLKTILKHKDQFKTPNGLCSVVYENGRVGRNLDWLYSNMASCIIKTDDNIGVAGAMKDFTKAFADSEAYNEDVYKMLPFFLQDGINSSGLCVSTLVTPRITVKSNVSSKNDSVCSIMLVRYLLDNYSSADECKFALENNLEVFFPNELLAMNYNQHWLIADKNTAYLFEVDEFGTPVFIEYTGQKAVITNFHHNNVVFNDDKTVYSPATQTSTQNAIRTNHIHEYGAGLERYNQLVHSATNTLNSMKQSLESVKYSSIYTKSNGYFTEFVNEEQSLTCASEPSRFDDIMTEYEELYPSRNRNMGEKGFGFWNTNHSAVYDLNECSMIVCSQENFDKWNEIPIGE